MFKHVTAKLARNGKYSMIPLKLSAGQPKLHVFKWIPVYIADIRSILPGRCLLDFCLHCYQFQSLGRECRLYVLPCQSLSYVLYKTYNLIVICGRDGCFCGEIADYDFYHTKCQYLSGELNEFRCWCCWFGCRRGTNL